MKSLKLIPVLITAALAVLLIGGCQNQPQPLAEQSQPEPLNNVPYSRGPSEPPNVKGPTAPPPGTDLSSAPSAQAVTKDENIRLTLPVQN